MNNQDHNIWIQRLRTELDDFTRSGSFEFKTDDELSPEDRTLLEWRNRLPLSTAAVRDDLPPAPNANDAGSRTLYVNTTRKPLSQIALTIEQRGAVSPTKRFEFWGAVLLLLICGGIVVLRNDAANLPGRYPLTTLGVIAGVWTLLLQPHEFGILLGILTALLAIVRRRQQSVRHAEFELRPV